jgi:hypothetical protein
MIEEETGWYHDMVLPGYPRPKGDGVLTCVGRAGISPPDPVHVQQSYFKYPSHDEIEEAMDALERSCTTH